MCRPTSPSEAVNGLDLFTVMEGKTCVLLTLLSQSLVDALLEVLLVLDRISSSSSLITPFVAARRGGPLAVTDGRIGL